MARFGSRISILTLFVALIIASLPSTSADAVRIATVGDGGSTAVGEIYCTPGVFLACVGAAAGTMEACFHAISPGLGPNYELCVNLNVAASFAMAQVLGSGDVFATVSPLGGGMPETCNEEVASPVFYVFKNCNVGGFKCAGFIEATATLASPVAMSAHASVPPACSDPARQILPDVGLALEPDLSQVVSCEPGWRLVSRDREVSDTDLETLAASLCPSSSVSEEWKGSVRDVQDQLVAEIVATVEGSDPLATMELSSALERALVSPTIEFTVQRSESP